MNENIVIGIREGWNERKAVTLSAGDRRQHFYAIGKSGTGKTTLLRNMILQDIEAGHGVGIIDPHGDLATEILNFIPRHRTEDVVYFDPSDREHCVGFNLFAQVPPERRHLVASGIVAAFKGIFPDFFGPRMEYIFYAAAAALLDCENVSLLGLQRMLSDDRYRAWVVRQIKDPAVRHFWQREFEAHDRKTKAEMVSPILNKIGPLLMAPPIRNILGQVQSRIDGRFMMDRGKIFVANLAKGKLGADKANLLGSFLVAHFQLSAMSRADIPEGERRDFHLYVDEFHSFVSDAFADILSEARKYRLCLTLSHQYMRQLKPGILDAIIGNVGSLVAFRVGHEDGHALERAFSGAYRVEHFTSLNNAEVLAKLLANGQDIEPVRGKTLPPKGAWHGRREAIVRRSQERYSRRRMAVERKLRKWFD